jgi:hypothetical protein
MSKTVAVMQPYIFPYVGYMSLVDASDTFVFYDDVNFIKKGWINRNRIVLNGEAYTFTLPLSGLSQNKHIKDIMNHELQAFSSKFINQLKLSYKNAKYFEEGLNYVDATLSSNCQNIADLSAVSVMKFFEYINLEKTFLKSSEEFSSTQGEGKAERLIDITKKLNCRRYVNAIGGTKLYSKNEFANQEIQLNFIKSRIEPYQQCNSNVFIGGLSVIDLVMNLSRDEIIHHIRSYEVI